MSEYNRNLITDQYGSKRGFAKVRWHRILYTLGRYRHYSDVNWRTVNRLIFVCTGNICRSPFAEVVAKSKGLDTVSCGIDAGLGAPASIYAIEAASRKGFDLRNHKTTPLASIIWNPGDLFITMEPCHLKRIETRFGANVGSTLLGLWHVRKYPHIADPYGATSAYFDHCFGLIEECIHGISSEIKKARVN